MKFLQQIAQFYTRRGDDLTRMTFVLPNKRSAMFLKRAFQQAHAGKVAFMPRFTTFSRLIARTASTNSVDRYDALFMLYDAYRDVLTARGNQSMIKDFDKFMFWGEMILNDFDEIDRALADPDMLYRNLRDLRSITADYLSPEQKTVIREIWGDTPLTSEINSFWLHTRPGHDDDDSVIKKFVFLWQILADLYDNFKNRLSQAGVASEGMQARMAVDKIRNTPADELANHTYVFVGLADVSAAQCAIMDRLKAVGAAEFFWDTVSPFPHGNTANRASRIVANLSRRYPAPDDFNLPPAAEKSIVEAIGVPSAIGQAQKAASIIKKYIDSETIDPADPIDTAIVLPDESLLAPLMLALPLSQDSEKPLRRVNVTMSLPYSSTAFATLFSSIIALHRNARKRRGRWTFFYKDVLEVLVHPHISIICPDVSERIRHNILTSHSYNIDAEELCRQADELAFIFRPVEDPTSIEEVSIYIESLIGDLRAAVSDKLPSHSARSIELDILDKLEETFSHIRNLVQAHGVTMLESTIFTLFERVLQSKQMSLNGTPLQGLQIMGALETRALDFDNIIFMSMNERSFPPHNFVRTMIPNNLRRGYGLAPIEQAESFYAYYFYRAIARASKVSLIYDSRPPDFGSGEMSRYITQLLYLPTLPKTLHSQVSFTSTPAEERVISVSKTESVLKELEKFKRPGGKNISATSLKSYMTCPLSFYLKYVRGLSDEIEPSDSLTPAQLGDVFHHTAQRLFEPYRGQLMTRAAYDEMIDGTRIHTIVREEISRIGYGSDTALPDDRLPVEAILVSAQIEAQIRFMLYSEASTYLENGSFTYIDGEYDVQKQWQVTPEHCINLHMQIDRIDRLADGQYRFIDYKTGSDDRSATKDLANLFTGEHSAQAVFQLLLYAEAYADLEEPGVTIEPALHIIRDIVKSGKIAPVLYDGEKMEPYPTHSELFRKKLGETISKIFDNSTPFTQCKDPADCKFCPFVSACGRIVPDKPF